jgi:hypothetical protein
VLGSALAAEHQTDVTPTPGQNSLERLPARRKLGMPGHKLRVGEIRRCQPGVVGRGAIQIVVRYFDWYPGAGRSVLFFRATSWFATRIDGRRFLNERF